MKLSVDKAIGILLTRCQGVSTLVVKNMKLTDTTYFSDDVFPKQPAQQCNSYFHSIFELFF